MNDILTLTMNPALDVSAAIDKVMPTHKLRCDAALRHPGGGGINVARVVHRLGGDCLALFPSGGPTGLQVQRLLAEEGVPSRCIDIAGETRESFSVHETSSGLDYRFVLPGPALQPHEWEACLAFVDGTEATDPPPRYLVASGSLPPGVPDDFFAHLARRAQARGVRLVLDTSGPPLAAALREGVYLVKPSLRELRELTGQPLTGEAEWQAAAQQLIADGRAQIVALSLGEQGALLAAAGQTLRAQALPVPVASTIGAGDSFVGGLVWALSRNSDLAEAFAWAMAASAAALLSAGTALCLPADVARLRNQVVITAA